MDYDIIDHQGWNEDTIRSLLEEFLEEKGLMDDFNDFLQEKADEVNGDDSFP